MQITERECYTEMVFAYLDLCGRQLWLELDARNAMRNSVVQRTNARVAEHWLAHRNKFSLAVVCL